MAPGIDDPRMASVHPRIRYNTIGGVNGPLVILEDVRWVLMSGFRGSALTIDASATGQIPPVQRDCVVDVA